MLSNLPIAKCRENYIINTNYFSNGALIILVGKPGFRLPGTGYRAWDTGVFGTISCSYQGYIWATPGLPFYQ